MEQIKIEYLPIGELKPYEKNARKHGEKDVEQIRKSIEKYGMNDPIGIWGDNNIIVEGHGRLMACRKLGMAEVPVIRLDHLTDEQRREYAIAHNATAELSAWDDDLLADEMSEIDLSEFDFRFDELQTITPDEFGTDFVLPDGDKPEICQMTFTLHERQKELIMFAIKSVSDDVSETFGNTNKNGNAMYEVVRQWEKLKKSKCE